MTQRGYRTICPRWWDVPENVDFLGKPWHRIYDGPI